jgi:hypothetical protein
MPVENGGEDGGVLRWNKEGWECGNGEDGALNADKGADDHTGVKKRQKQRNLRAMSLFESSGF